VIGLLAQTTDWQHNTDELYLEKVQRNGLQTAKDKTPTKLILWTSISILISYAFQYAASLHIYRPKCYNPHYIPPHYSYSSNKGASFHPTTAAGPFRNLSKIRRPTNNVRRLSVVPHGTYPAPSLNTGSENLILTWKH